MFVKRVENNIDRCNLENILPDGSVEVLYLSLIHIFFGGISDPERYGIEGRAIRSGDRTGCGFSAIRFP